MGTKIRCETMAKDGGEGGCGCAIALIIFIAAGINYELEHAFEGGIWAWIICVVLIILAFVLGVGGIIGGIIKSIIDMFK